MPADKNLATVAEGDHRKRRARTFRIFDYFGLLPLHHGDAGIGRSEIDVDCLGHDRCPCMAGLHAQSPAATK